MQIEKDASQVRVKNVITWPSRDDATDAYHKFITDSSPPLRPWGCFTTGFLWRHQETKILTFWLISYFFRMGLFYLGLELDYRTRHTCKYSGSHWLITQIIKKTILGPRFMRPSLINRHGEIGNAINRSLVNSIVFSQKIENCVVFQIVLIHFGHFNPFQVFLTLFEYFYSIFE